MESKQLMRFGLGWIVAVGLGAVPLVGAAQVMPHPAWLQYAIPPDPPRYHDMPHAVVQLGDAPEEKTAADELDIGLGHMVAGTDRLLRRFDPHLDSIVLGTTDMLRRVRGIALVDRADAALPEDGYRIRRVRSGPRQWWVLEGGSPRGELYAAFRFAALVSEDRQLPDRLQETAKMPLRALDLRGNLRDLPAEGRLPVLGRLMASVGMNGLVVDAGSMAPIEVVSAMRPFGIRVWFRGADAEALSGIAGLGGVVVDAHDVAAVDAAARLLRRHGATVLLEGALDGDAAAPMHGLEPNVVLVGDAMPRSLPLAGLASPNFGLMPGAVQAARFQLFPANARAVVFPAAIWESALATPEHGAKGDATLTDVLARKAEGNVHGGVVATVTVADVAAMIAQPMMQVNLFGFGRVAWNPADDPEEIADTWARQSFSDDARSFGVARDIAVGSAAAFVNVSAPYGLPVLGEEGRPDPARVAAREGGVADAQGIGVDRSAMIARYPAAFAAELADVERCPERWLLALHRVPPTRRLLNTKTVVQAFYDLHFSGASQMTNALDAWESTKGLVDEPRFEAIHEMLSSSARHGEVWRDSSSEWMERATGVADEPHFVGSHPGRVEAETMKLKGYAKVRAAQPEDASGGSYISCVFGPDCSAEADFLGETNVYRVEVGFYGAGANSSLELRVNGVAQAHWNVEPGPGAPGASNAERYVVNGVRLKPGDHIAVQGSAAVDFFEVSRDPRWN